jgi:CRP-like cAMP-binding protein
MFTALRRAFSGLTPTGNLDPYIGELAVALMAHRSVGLGLHLSRAEADVVAGFMTLKRVSAGEVIVRVGRSDDTPSCMLLVQGTVTVEGAPIDNYPAEVLNVLSPGAFLDKLSMMDGLPHAASFLASSDVVLATLKRDAFLLLLDQEPAIAAKFVSLLALGLATALRAHLQRTLTSQQLVKALETELEHQFTPSRLPDFAQMPDDQFIDPVVRGKRR